MDALRAFRLPTWYLACLSILLLAYLGGWVYTVHIGQIERAESYTPVMPVGDHDSTSYANLAQSILQGHFAEPGEAFEYFHTPGYPAFVAAVLWITHSYFVVTFLQILMLFATALMTYVIGRQLVSEKVGLWASILLLLNPLWAANAYWIITDILFTFLFVLAITLIVTKFTKEPLLITLIAAVLFGAAIYVRPVGFIAYPVFAAPMLALAYPWSKKIGYAALMLLVTTILLVPWLARNYEHSGVFSFTSLVSFNMSYYSLPHFWSDTQHIPLDQGLAKIQAESGVPEGIDQNGYPANWYNLASSPKLSAYYQRVILSSPVKYVAWHLFYSSAFFFAPAVAPAHLSQNIKLLAVTGHIKEAIGALMSPWWFFAERVLVFAGLLLLIIGVWRLRYNFLALAFVLVILYMAALGGPSTAARYRIPLEPLLSTFMAVGLFTILRKDLHEDRA